LTEQIGFVYVRAQTTKHVQVSTIACSSSAMLEQAQLDALDMSNVSSLVETWRDEPSGIWALHENGTSCIYFAHMHGTNNV